MSTPRPDDPTDAVLWTLLRHSPRFDPADAERALRWWSGARAGEEGLAGFLIRQGVLDAAAVGDLRWLAEPAACFEPDLCRVRNPDVLGLRLPEEWFAAPRPTSAAAPAPTQAADFAVLADSGVAPRSELRVAGRRVPKVLFGDVLSVPDALQRLRRSSETAPVPTPVPASADPPACRSGAPAGVTPPDGHAPPEPARQEPTASASPATDPAGNSGHVALRDSFADGTGSSMPPAEEPPAPDAPPGVGSTLGKCLLTDLVGEGASSLVFRALHRSLGIPVAVKVLTLDRVERDERLLRLLRSEARVLASLNHPNIVRVFDFEDEGRFPYLVLEYVEGLSLAGLIAQSGRLAADNAVRIALQVAEGLAAAGRLGVIHRDIKPANILLARDGAAKVADLGLAVVAKMRRDNPGESDPGRSSAKSKGSTGGSSAIKMLAGTAGYMAPEQAMGSRDLDHRADIYSLGATLYHAVVGRVPFTGRNALEVMVKHAREAPRSPLEAVPELDPALSELILRMLAKAPGQRFQTYEELIAALQRLTRAGGPTKTDRPESADRSDSGPRPGWTGIFSLFRRRESEEGR